MCVKVFSDISHVMTKIYWEGTCTSSQRKLKRTCTLLGLKNMTSYKRIKPATGEPFAHTYLELKMVCLFYFILESEKIVIMSDCSGTVETVLFSPFYTFLLFQFQMSIDSWINSSCSLCNSSQ